MAIDRGSLASGETAKEKSNTALRM